MNHSDPPPPYTPVNMSTQYSASANCNYNDVNTFIWQIINALRNSGLTLNENNYSDILNIINPGTASAHNDSKEIRENVLGALSTIVKQNLQELEYNSIVNSGCNFLVSDPTNLNARSQLAGAFVQQDGTQTITGNKVEDYIIYAIYPFLNPYGVIQRSRQRSQQRSRQRSQQRSQQRRRAASRRTAARRAAVQRMSLRQAAQSGQSRSTTSGGKKQRTKKLRDKKTRRKNGGHHLYKRLGVSKYASMKKIRKQYNKLKKNKKLTKKIKHAYKILSNKKSRRQYNHKYKK